MRAGGGHGWNNRAAFDNIGSSIDRGGKLISDLSQVYTRGNRKVIRNTCLKS